MKLLLKSVGFGTVCTTFVVAVAYGLAALINYLEQLGSCYAVAPIFALVCIVCSTAYYFDNK